MYNLLLQFVLLALLILVIYQDMAYRTIHITLPIMIFIGSIAFNIISDELTTNDAIYNSLFLLINILGLFLYYSFKKGQFFNPIDKYIGVGDLAFLFSITPILRYEQYILFFVSGLIFSLLVYVIFSQKISKNSIPLAAYLSIFLIPFYSIINFLPNVNIL